MKNLFVASVRMHARSFLTEMVVGTARTVKGSPAAVVKTIPRTDMQGVVKNDTVLVTVQNGRASVVHP